MEIRRGDTPTLKFDLPSEYGINDLYTYRIVLKQQQEDAIYTLIKQANDCFCLGGHSICVMLTRTETLGFVCGIKAQAQINIMDNSQIIFSSDINDVTIKPTLSDASLSAPAYRLSINADNHAVVTVTDGDTSYIHDSMIDTNTIVQVSCQCDAEYIFSSLTINGVIYATRNLPRAIVIVSDINIDRNLVIVASTEIADVDVVVDGGDISEPSEYTSDPNYADVIVHNHNHNNDYYTKAEIDALLNL